MLETDSGSKDDSKQKESSADDSLHNDSNDSVGEKYSFLENQHKEENIPDRNDNLVQCYSKNDIDEFEKGLGLPEKNDNPCENHAFKEDQCDILDLDEKCIKENVNIEQEFDTSKSYFDNNIINEAEIIDNQSLKSIDASSLDHSKNDKDHPTDNTKQESDALEVDECLQFTRNFKLALEQAEARGKVSKTTNNLTFQPLRRATKKISNRIKFLQEQLQQEVTSGFTNRKNVERLKKQLVEAEEMSASIQSIKKHHRSVSRSGRSTTRSRHSVTPGKRERPYRHWHGLNTVVTPGPDCRFIISSRDANENKKLSVGSQEISRLPKNENLKVKLTKEIAVNTIVEEAEPECLDKKQADSSITKCITSSILEESAHYQERLQDSETCLDKDLQSQLSNIAINNEGEDKQIANYCNVNTEIVSEKSETEFSNDGANPINCGDMMADIADAIERLDLKHMSPARVNNNKLKNNFFNNNIQPDADCPDGFHPKRSEPSKFLIDIDNLKQERSNKSLIIDRPNPFKCPTINQEYTPYYKPNANNASYDRTLLDSIGSPCQSFYESSQLNMTKTFHSNNDNNELPHSISRNNYPFPYNDIKDTSPNLCQSHYEYSLQENNDSSSPITRKRFTSPYYNPKRPSNSKAYHPMPCINHLKHGTDNQSRLRRHKDRSLSRMAARSGSRSLARQHRPRGLLRNKPGDYTDDIEREIEVMREEALLEKKLFSRPPQEPIVSPDKSKTESNMRLMNKVNSLRRGRGLKYVAVRAIQDYKGKLPGQLSFKAGQCIKVRHPEFDPPDGLFYGYYRKGRLRTKKKGLFPISCVELQSEMQTAL